ncbi:MAG TPA: hypothetical protein VK509_25485, partial [Polyangiales bacterium]|nr:hypothetical protein [Polyangiales bacterium]
MLGAAEVPSAADSPVTLGISRRGASLVEVVAQSARALTPEGGSSAPESGNGLPAIHLHLAVAIVAGAAPQAGRYRL